MNAGTAITSPFSAAVANSSHMLSTHLIVDR